MPHSIFLILEPCSSARLALAIKVKFGSAQWQLMVGHFNTVTIKYWPGAASSIQPQLLTRC
jgi:hypothetical protein